MRHATAQGAVALFPYPAAQGAVASDRREALRRSAVWAKPLAVLATLLHLGGCALIPLPPQTQALLASPPTGLPVQVERTGTPFFPQTPYHCGPAALATVLADAGLPATPQDLAQAVFLPAREGSLQVEMLAGARRQGALAYQLPGTLAALLREVAGGLPVVVLQNLGLDFIPRWHYAVLVGYDLTRREVVLRSGVTLREVMSLATFERTWARGNRWAIAVLPPGRLPLGVDEAGATQAALAFERVARPAQAALAWQAVSTRWPDSVVAGMGVGNTWLAAGELRAAAAAFEQVAQRHDSAVAWNNLAQVHLRRGDTDAALAAAQRAVDRARDAEPAWRAAAEDTLREVQAARESRKPRPRSAAAP